MATLPILAAGLVTMNSFTAAPNLAGRQLIWILLSLSVFLAASFLDWRFLRRSEVVILIYLAGILLLLSTSLFNPIRGARSWLDFGAFSLQPVDLMKLILIIILAKYFSRRHIEIARFRHVVISGLYALFPFILVMFQPDFGGALIIFLIWLGQILVAGVSRKHLLLIFFFGVVAAAAVWFFVFEDYQKARVISFLHPLADIAGAGYNAFQSTIAVGSGELFGKGVGFGTQSRLEFLPEYQTDFIFAAFAEEWGFVGVTILFALFGVVIWRILAIASRGATNFELLFGTGLAIYLTAHFAVNVGMNIGLLPVTGITMPFMSHGGSHLLAEFLGLGILMGQRAYSLAVHRLDAQRELLGVIE